MARTLNTTVMVDGVVYEAGTAEADIKGEITAQGVWDGEADGDAGKGYSGLKVDDLKAEITSRNEGRDDADLISLDGNKPDLIAALEADDVAQA